MTEQSTEICTKNLDRLVQEHMGLLIQTVSSVTGRYVSVENDDEFSIALSAFAEAVGRYDESRGPFAPYAALVIKSRLSNYLLSCKQNSALSLDALCESGQEPADNSMAERLALREEIMALEQELFLFDLGLEDLVGAAPRHRDARSRAVGIARTGSRDEKTVALTYQKKRLPIRALARLCSVSEKIVKTGKLFILAVMLIFVNQLPILTDWFREV